MEITVSQEQGRTPVSVLHIKGEMTADTAEPFERAAREAIEGGATHLALDLTDVPYIGSFGIRSLNNVLNALHAAADGYGEADLRKALRGGAKSPRLKLVNPNAQCLKVLETSGFDMYLESHRSVKDAVASF